MPQQIQRCTHAFRSHCKSSEVLQTNDYNIYFYSNLSLSFLFPLSSSLHRNVDRIFISVVKRAGEMRFARPLKERRVFSQHGFTSPVISGAEKRRSLECFHCWSHVRGFLPRVENTTRASVCIMSGVEQLSQRDFYGNFVISVDRTFP